MLFGEDERVQGGVGKYYYLTILGLVVTFVVVGLVRCYKK
jgi:hypothetical protein